MSVQHSFGCMSVQNNYYNNLVLIKKNCFNIAFKKCAAQNLFQYLPTFF